MLHCRLVEDSDIVVRLRLSYWVSASLSRLSLPDCFSLRFILSHTAADCTTAPKCFNCGGTGHVRFLMHPSSSLRVDTDMPKSTFPSFLPDLSRLPQCRCCKSLLRLRRERTHQSRLPQCRCSHRCLKEGIERSLRIILFLLSRFSSRSFPALPFHSFLPSTDSPDSYPPAFLQDSDRQCSVSRLLVSFLYVES